MASGLYIFDGSSSSSSFLGHSSPEIVSSDMTTDCSFLYNSDTLTCLDVLEAITDNQTQRNPVDESSPFDHFSPSLLSTSPPRHQLENLTICPATQLQSQPNSSFLANGYGYLTGFDSLEVKTEQSFDIPGYNQKFVPHGHNDVENLAKYMQRSFSSNSFDGKPGFRIQSLLDVLVEPMNPNYQTLSPPENGFFAGQMRRVCSTGDLQSIRRNSTKQTSYSSSLGTESSSSFMEEPNFKVGRYSAEERKEKISKYRAKRTQRNFNKTIKYACRKTLADNRPRVRGRFARNDEVGETPKPATCSSARGEEEDDLWLVDGPHEDGEALASSFRNPLFQYHGRF